MYRNKRGQAAMEFLMTYGWAILAAIIVVGVLWYIIGSPGNLAGDQFKLSQPFSANAMSLSTTELQLEVRNGAGNPITITDVTFDAGSGCTDLTGQTIAVADGALQVLTITCAFNQGDRLSSDVTIKYTETGSLVTQQATGSITAQVP
ncbi:hypothetical protein HYT23_03705 [Candidatus Pacearchaeota archaeon]|nr:hypothetical protein [Candidatus Pacearchaeota archaeon]